MARYPKARPGDRTRRHITANAWNAVVDLVNDPNGPPVGGPDPFRGNNATRIQVKADAAYDRFGVIGLASPLILPSANLAEFQSRVAFTGQSPAAANQFKFAVLQEPAPAGAIVSAIVAGVTPCKVYVTSSAHQYADVKAGDKTQLASAPVGKAQILWREPITTYPASVQAFVLLGIPSTPFVLGKTDSTLNKGSSGPVSVFSGAFPNEADTGENVTVVNRFANVASTKWLIAAWLNSNWYAITAECG